MDELVLPSELTARPQWVVWRHERNTKVPYNARTGGRASTSDPSTWSDYTTAHAAASGYDGLGYVFSADDPYVGIDFDDCIVDDQVVSWVRDALASLNSYAEVSPSGTGIKVWVAGHIPSSIKTKQLEMYQELRYFTTTGWHVEGTPLTIRAVNGELDALYAYAQQLAEQERAAKRPTPAQPTMHTRPAHRTYLERWAQSRIDYAVDRVARAIDGEKHHERYRMARLLGGLIPHGLATAEQVADVLFDANVPASEAQRREYQTLLDGARDGARDPLPLPDAPPQPIYDEAGFACCPVHQARLPQAKNGNGYKCHRRDSSTETGWCDFWWDGEGYSPPPAVDPETGEVLAAGSDNALLSASRSDTGNAEALALLHGDDLRYCHTRKKWLRWDGARWAIDEIGHAYELMIATIRARLHASEVISDPDQRKKAMAWCVGCESATKLESALRVASRREPFRTMVQEYDADPMLAATSGETLDLRAVIRRPVRREDYLTMRLGAAYDPEARADRWRQFLVEVFAGDAEVIAYIQRAVGYSLTGDTREQKLFLLHGSGNNGKSVFLDVLSQLLGDYAGNASFETFDAARRNESTNDLAALRGKRLVTVIETEEGRKLAEARVKSVTGQDQITCRFLYGEYFSYRPEFKIWLAMNHLPIIRGTDRGIWRRIQLIPFTQNFDGREDKTLRDKLMAELPGILGWALEGLRQWHARGLDAPQIVQQAVANYRAESDQIGRWITEQCVVTPQASMPSGAGYKSYHDWCETSGEHAESQNKWGRVLTDKGFDRADVRNVRVWLGIGLRTESEDR